MKTLLINILRFPRKKGNYLNPWYVILWRISLYPFVIVLGTAFYLMILLFHLDVYAAEQFRKEWVS